MSRAKERKAVRDFLQTVPLDREEVYALQASRGLDRETARLAHRISACDPVDLAQALLPLLRKSDVT